MSLDYFLEGYLPNESNRVHCKGVTVKADRSKTGFVKRRVALILLPALSKLITWN